MVKKDAATETKLIDHSALFLQANMATFYMQRNLGFMLRNQGR